MKTIIETTKNYWGYFLVGLITLILLIHFTFFWYPILINKLILFHVPNHDFSKEGFGRGTFGDMYGALNSFVSSVAFLGALSAIYIQINQFKIDKEIAKNDKEELSNLLIKYFRSNLDKLNSETISPLQSRLNKIISKKFSWSEVYFDVKLNNSSDYYFRALLSTSQNEIFQAYHSVKHPDADKIIEIYFRVESLLKGYNQLNNLLIISRKELKKMESEAFQLKVTLLIKDQNGGNKLGFLRTHDLFDIETLSLLEREYTLQQHNTELASLINLLEDYFWKKNDWMSQITSLEKEISDFIKLINPPKN